MMKKPTLTALLFSFLFFKAFAQTYTPGQSYFGTNGYVEYLAGNLPIIVTAPHGGLLSPASIPDRDCAGCTTVNDFNTQELARAFAAAVHERTGCWPHVIFNKLHRRKLDANRDLLEAADGNPDAELAWNEFHIFVETAKNQVLPTFGKGFYMDFHGHGHDIQRLELGYLLSQTELQLADNVLDGQTYIKQSSIRHLASNNALELSHSELLRGPLSLGSLLSGRGYPATPSLPDPFPDPDEDYFDGGYNTVRHSSYQFGGRLDGVQIECNRQGVRDSMHNVLRFADSLSVTLLEYLGLHYFGDAAESLCPSDPALPAPPVPDFFDIFPNPYCVHFFVKLTDHAPAGDWVCEVYDFYGNLLKTKPLEQDQTLEIAPRNRENVLVVLRRDGAVAALQAVLQLCR
ncbi:MAG: hypothetical protein H7246_22845 [Phycisphaerae bacterium]|nr:hypothetical protein [Saprospiraceae bacterium]